MRTLNPSEKRTIRYATVGISIYLALFGGLKAGQFFSHQRDEYRKLLAEGRRLRLAAQPFADKSAVAAKLMADFHFDPAKLSRTSLVADASAAIQKAAMGGGLQPGPVRELSARASNKELASIQVEASGQVASLMSFLQRLPTLGFPLQIDSVQLSSEPMQPGMMKLNVTVLVLDFDQWKNQEASHA